MDIACLVKAFQAVMDVPVNVSCALSLLRSAGLLRPFVKVTWHQLCHKSSTQMTILSNTGCLLHKWQHMCTVHRAHDARLLDSGICSIWITLQRNLQCKVLVLAGCIGSYFIDSSPTSLAQFPGDFIVGFPFCPALFVSAISIMEESRPRSS